MRDVVLRTSACDTPTTRRLLVPGMRETGVGRAVLWECLRRYNCPALHRTRCYWTCLCLFTP